LGLGLVGCVLGFRSACLGLHRVCLGLGRVCNGFAWVGIGLKLAFTRGFWGFTEKKTGQNQKKPVSLGESWFIFVKNLIISGQNRKRSQENHPACWARNADGQEKTRFCREEARYFWGPWTQKRERFWKKGAFVEKRRLVSERIMGVRRQETGGQGWGPGVRGEERRPV
jgi:hypothetical protein